jgi:hypothetical protein
VQFLFNLFNHTEVGRRSLEDVIAIVGHQLNALGHRAVYVAQNDQFVTSDSGINVVVEGFTPATTAAIASAHMQGARFLILATEEPTPKGFNWGTQKEMVWRQDTFPAAARHCEGILHLVPGEHVTRWYAQHAPTAEADLGYSPTLMRGDRFIVPDYEFGFYGSLTPRRKRVLKALAKMLPPTPKAIRLMVDFGSQMDRDMEMQRAKVIVQVRKFEAMGLVSSSRCNTALTLGRPIVPEPHEHKRPWDEVIDFPETMEQFFGKCMAVRAAWKSVHAAQLERFKVRMSPERCLGQALAAIGICGGTAEARAAA